MEGKSYKAQRRKWLIYFTRFSREIIFIPYYKEVIKNVIKVKKKKKNIKRLFILILWSQIFSDTR